MDDDELFTFAKKIAAPYDSVMPTKQLGRFPVVHFTVGGVATPMDAALMTRIGHNFSNRKTLDEAELAKEKTNGYKLDRAHVFAVNMFDEIEKFMKVPDEWAPPETKPYTSGNEYKRGISGWNFNLEDMKAQASLEENNLIRNQAAPLSSADSTGTFNIAKYEKSDDDMSIASSSHEQQIWQGSPHNENQFENNLVGKPDLEMNGRFLEGMVTHPHTRRGGSSGSIIAPDTVLSTSKGDMTFIAWGKRL